MIRHPTPVIRNVIVKGVLVSTCGLQNPPSLSHWTPVQQSKTPPSRLLKSCSNPVESPPKPFALLFTPEVSLPKRGRGSGVKSGFRA